MHLLSTQSQALCHVHRKDFIFVEKILYLHVAKHDVYLG